MLPSKMSREETYDKSQETSDSGANDCIRYPEITEAHLHSKQNAEDESGKDKNTEQVQPRRLGWNSDKRIFFSHGKGLCFFRQWRKE